MNDRPRILVAEQIADAGVELLRERFDVDVTTEWADGALAESIGGPRVIFGEQAPEVEQTFRRLRETAQRVLGDRAQPLLACYRVRIGVVR